MRVTWPIALAAYVMAHVFYWPAALATRWVGSRLTRASTSLSVLIMAGFSVILSVLFALPAIYLPMTDLPYGWRAAGRDAGDLAVAGALAFFLHRSLLSNVTWVSNNRWRGP